MVWVLQASLLGLGIDLLILAEGLPTSQMLDTCTLTSSGTISSGSRMRTNRLRMFPNIPRLALAHCRSKVRASPCKQ